MLPRVPSLAMRSCVIVCHPYFEIQLGPLGESKPEFSAWQSGMLQLLLVESGQGLVDDAS